MNVFYVEEPIPTDGDPSLDCTLDKTGVTVVVPHLQLGPDSPPADDILRRLLDQLLAEREIREPVLWYYTPMASAFSDHLDAGTIVYDCMDELSLFRFAPPALIENERRLMARADVVFTGGYSLYEAKQTHHCNVHPFPSSVDVAHFAKARTEQNPPADQADIPHPRIGFFGVIDERMDLSLLSALADARPDWHVVMIGPVVKVDEAELPRRPNIHYLGPKQYDSLPDYIRGWDVALMPFALNESTRFISPTKTPEYLAAGKPVVSTPIRDVVRHYGALEGVEIADGAQAFIDAVARGVTLARRSQAWLPKVDAVLAGMSWDATWGRMNALVDEALDAKARPKIRPAPINGASEASRHGGSRRWAKNGGRGGVFDYLVVGAGFAGSVMAERLAASAGKRVLVIDRRPHIGGNAFDHLNDAGLLVHRYGPHIFHTNAPHVADYLSRFTAWRDYEHRVLAQIDDKRVPIPINRTTINQLYDLSLSPDEVDAFLEARAEPPADGTIRTSEDVVVARIGRELYDRFFRGYTRKQWGLDPSELDKAVTARIPTRNNDDDRYFTDSFQKMPLHGYTRMFEAMLDHPNIEVMTGVDYHALPAGISYERLVYTGPIDEFFEHRFGKLPYRSLRFDHETLDTEKLQPVAVVNYPDESVPFTRVTEFKHLTGQAHPKTSITREFPQAEGDPYYPIPASANQALYRRYQALANARDDVIFVGRLASYRYYNMDQVVAQALTTFDRLADAEDRATSASRLAAAT